MSNKSIISLLIIFLVMSFLYLAFVSERNYKNQDWWSVYFQDPKSNSLNFTIENNSRQNKFHYILTANEKTLKEADAEVKKGTKKDIPIENVPASGKIVIQIITGNDKKEIYKIF